MNLLLIQYIHHIYILMTLFGVISPIFLAGRPIVIQKGKNYSCTILRSQLQGFEPGPAPSMGQRNPAREKNDVRMEMRRIFVCQQ